MNDEQKRMLFAVIISAVILFSWQKFFAPDPTLTKTTPKNQKEVLSENISDTEIKQMPELEAKVKSFQSINIANDLAEFKITSSLIVIPVGSKFADIQFDKILGSEFPYTMEFSQGERFSTLEFTLEKNQEDGFVARSTSGIVVRGKINRKGNLDLNFKSDNEFKFRLKFQMKAESLENNQVRRFSYYSDDLESIDIGDEDRAEAKVNWFGIDFNYHLFAFSFKDSKSFLFESREINDGASGAVLAQKATSATDLAMTITYTKKDYDRLVTLGHKLSGSVDFGIWKIIAVPILRGLQFFYTLIPNYGIAIILLTLVIRLITFPLQYKSFKSMKKMQTIQPELTKLRDKFKDDPQRMQKESMMLFKRSGANPLGGCLPLILQMPVFFAFYKVLYSAVELVGAPFTLWIHDLSVKDPYYVLPVLMALAMFLQQKLTPTTTADPTQKKVMMFMPLIFGMIMKDLPAGLCLYIFVSTIFGMSQQLLVYRTVD